MYLFITLQCLNMTIYFYFYTLDEDKKKTDAINNLKGMILCNKCRVMAQNVVIDEGNHAL